MDARLHEPKIRMATPSDAEAVRDIYAPFIRDTAVSFEAEVPTVEEMGRRMEVVLAEAPWLVAVSGGRVIGYAYAGAHRARHAYRFSRETSVYLAPEARGKGIATRLYAVLLDILVRQGFCTAVAGATLPNPASVHFHEKMGFEVLGTFHRIGYKFGEFHDVIWMEKRLRDAPPEQLQWLPELGEAELVEVLGGR